MSRARPSCARCGAHFGARSRPEPVRAPCCYPAGRMHARASSLVVLALMIGGCPKSSPPSVPSWDEGGNDNEGVMAAHDPNPAGEEEAPPATSAGTTDPVATTDPPETDPPPTEKPPLELPKAKHTKIDDSCGKDAGLGQKLKSFELKTV